MQQVKQIAPLTELSNHAQWGQHYADEAHWRGEDARHAHSKWAECTVQAITTSSTVHRAHARASAHESFGIIPSRGVKNYELEDGLTTTPHTNVGVSKPGHHRDLSLEVIHRPVTYSSNQTKQNNNTAQRQGIIEQGQRGTA